jgi:acetylornithine deacetylase/succinyl-diaminopimelate desuccinylase-like protein
MAFWRGSLMTKSNALSNLPAPTELLQALISCGRNGETAVQEQLARYVTALGADVEQYGYEPSTVVMRHEFADGLQIAAGQRTALIARIVGSGGGKSLILFAHPDSEPVAAPERWSADPFTGAFANGRIHGWGVADDLSGVAAMVSGLGAALADGWRPRGDIILASTPSKRHARGVAAVLNHIPVPDAAIYLHPAESGAGMGEIKACTPGLLEFRIEITGTPPDTQEIGHSAFAHRATNAIEAARPILDALLRLDAERGERVRHGRIEAAVGRATNVMISAIVAGKPGARNRLPVTCSVEGSVSFPPGETLQSLMEEIRNAIGTVSLPAGAVASIAFPSGVCGAETAADHPLFGVVAAAVFEEAGITPVVNPLHTASDIRLPILQKGIPTVGLGPLGGDLTQNGRTDEWVDAADHDRCVRVVARTIRNWCG